MEPWRLHGSTWLLHLHYTGAATARLLHGYYTSSMALYWPYVWKKPVKAVSGANTRTRSFILVDKPGSEALIVFSAPFCGPLASLRAEAVAPAA
jgi:hypothetical protein